MSEVLSGSIGCKELGHMERFCTVFGVTPLKSLALSPTPDVKYVMKILGGGRYLVRGSKHYRYEYEFYMGPTTGHRFIQYLNINERRCVEMTPPEEPTAEQKTELADLKQQSDILNEEFW